MASLWELLAAQSIKGEDDYNKNSPWMNSGRNVLNTPIQPKNNLEAILGPIALGLAGGAMQGYGKREANREAYQDYSNNPILQGLTGYGEETMPSDWTTKQGQQDLILNALKKQQIDDSAAALAAEKSKVLLALAGSDNPETQDLAIAELKENIGLGSTPTTPRQVETPSQVENLIDGIDTSVAKPTVGLGDRRRQLQRETGSIEMGDKLFEHEQKESKKELANKTEVAVTLEEVANVYDEASKVTQTKETLPGISYLTNEGAVLGGSKAVIMGFLQKFAKGNPSDKENAVLQQAMPKWYDSPERVLIKKEKMLVFLKLSAAGIPYLDGMEKAGMDVGDSSIRARETNVPGGDTSTTVSPKNPGESVPDYLKRTRK